MSDHIIATRIAERDGTDDPLRSLHNAIVFSSADWSEARDMAWVYGIAVGWDDEDDIPGGGAMDELAGRFGWSAETVARLRRLHSEFNRRAGGES